MTSESKWAQIPSWFSVVVALVTAIFAVGVTYATMKNENAYQDRRLDRLEISMESIATGQRQQNEALEKRLNELSQGLARIEGKLSK